MDFGLFKGKKVIITGGLGFIGSTLAIKLVEWGAKVVVVDSLIPEYGGNLFNVKGYEGRLKVNIADVRDEFGMSQLIRGEDFLFNLAGQTSHIDSMENPFTDLDINCRAQLFILEACRKYNPSIKVVYAGTRQVYGKPDFLPVHEEHPIRPVDVNGIHKMAGEWYHLLYHQVYGIRTCALRLTNTYGPRMRIKDARQTFLGVWIRALIEGKPIEIWGDGLQLRDFNYVDDAVSCHDDGGPLGAGGRPGVQPREPGSGLAQGARGDDDPDFQGGGVQDPALPQEIERRSTSETTTPISTGSSPISSGSRR